ncbi:transposase orfB [Roseobacter sp. SK209-2-6]|nr:transposase orfB [Roseobacter sp. SK209-2-6]EBA16374.1 transposase orfB [Roseobacter sp. SK209-2-6]
MRKELGVSERRACRTLGQHRSTQRKVSQGRADEERLTDDIIELADQYGRYGYRMVTGLLNNAGWPPLGRFGLAKSPAGQRMIRVDLKLNSTDVLDTLTDLFILRGPPQYIRSDNGPLAIGLEPMAPSMARSSLPRRSGTGSPPSAQKPLISNQGHPSRDIAMRCPAGQCMGERLL